MQPRNYFTDAADWFLKRNPEPNLLSDKEYGMVREKIEHWSSNGIMTLPPGRYWGKVCLTYPTQCVY